MITHYKTCANPSAATTDVDTGDGFAARTCNECGAFEIIESMRPAKKSPELLLWDNVNQPEISDV